jgi:hypothetical protein
VHPNHYRPTLARALILSPDPLVGALLGAAAELGGCEPVFQSESETAGEALRSTRPALLLVDAEDPSARDETLLGNAMMIGARMFVFGTASAIAALGKFPDRYRLRRIVIPRDVEGLPDLLFTEATESSRHPPQSTVP